MCNPTNNGGREEGGREDQRKKIKWNRKRRKQERKIKLFFLTEAPFIHVG